MRDALKLAEEVLLDAVLQIEYLHGKFDHTASGEQVLTRCNHAADAIRAARAEWGWRPIAELPEGNKDVLWLAMWSNWLNQWVKSERQYTRAYAIANGYTLFCRFTLPQLPPPPTREEVENE